jgi:lactoylglutathione lyase
VDQLAYVILYVSDITASIAFYRDVVGVPFTFEDAGYAEFASQQTRLALYEARRAAWLTGHDVTPGPAAEIVFMVPDVDAQARRLTTLGAPVLSGPTDRPWGHRTVHVADPDGFIVEFAQEIPRRRPRRSPVEGASERVPEHDAPIHPTRDPERALNRPEQET